MPSPSHWPSLEVVKAAAEKSSSVRPLSSAQLSQLLSAAIEEMSAPKVKELLATHPHVLQEKDWELVMRTALKHFDPAVHDILDQDNPIFAPFWYIEQLKQKGSAPLFNALMAKMEASSTPILPLSTKNVLDELWKYALKELFNPTAAPNARLVRALVLEKDPSIANDPACFVLYERTVDDLAHTSLDRLTAEDHEFLEGLPSVVKTRYTQALFENFTLSNLSIQQLHSVYRFLDQHPSYLQELRFQEKRNQQQQQDIHALWRAIIPPGTHFWKDTHIENFAAAAPTTIRIKGKIHGSRIELGPPPCLPGVEDFLDKGVWPGVDKATDIRLGLDLFDEMIVYAPNFEVLAEQRSTDGQTNEVVFGGGGARAYDWWTTLVVRSSPAIASLTHTPQVHDCVDNILADKSKRLGWVIELTPSILEGLCTHRPDLKQWTDEHGNTLLHYLFALNAGDDESLMEFAAIHPQWVTTHNLNGVSAREIAVHNEKAEMDQQLEKMILSLHVQKECTRPPPARKI